MKKTGSSNTISVILNVCDVVIVDSDTFKLSLVSNKLKFFSSCHYGISLL